MNIDQKLVSLLAQTKIKALPDHYAIISLPLEERKAAKEACRHVSAAFFSLTFSPYEITLVIPLVSWEGIRERFRRFEIASPYRVIILDIALDLEVVGYLAVISEALAQKGISVYALSTYLKDVLLVKASDLPAALEVLEKLAMQFRQ